MNIANHEHVFENVLLNVDIVYVILSILQTTLLCRTVNDNKIRLSPQPHRLERNSTDVRQKVSCDIFLYLLSLFLGWVVRATDDSN